MNKLSIRFNETYFDEFGICVIKFYINEEYKAYRICMKLQVPSYENDLLKEFGINEIS